MNNATVRSLRETNRNNDVVAAQASCTIGVDNHKRFHARGIKERGQARFGANRTRQLGADSFSVLCIQRDHSKRTIGG